MTFHALACRCGGIGRHAVLRGQWRFLRASSSLAIGTGLRRLVLMAIPQNEVNAVVATAFFAPVFAAEAA